MKGQRTLEKSFNHCIDLIATLFLCACSTTGGTSTSCNVTARDERISFDSFQRVKNGALTNVGFIRFVRSLFWTLSSVSLCTTSPRTRIHQNECCLQAATTEGLGFSCIFVPEYLAKHRSPATSNTHIPNSNDDASPRLLTFFANDRVHVQRALYQFKRRQLSLTSNATPSLRGVQDIPPTPLLCKPSPNASVVWATATPRLPGHITCIPSTPKPHEEPLDSAPSADDMAHTRPPESLTCLHTQKLTQDTKHDTSLFRQHGIFLCSL